MQENNEQENNEQENKEQENNEQENKEEENKNKNEMYFDVSFWFCTTTGLALPFIYLCYDTVPLSSMYESNIMLYAKPVLLTHMLQQNEEEKEKKEETFIPYFDEVD